MKTLLIVVGALLIITSLYYFARLIFLLLNSYEFTDYGFGILAGRFILLALGILLLYLGIKRKSKTT
jgi:hypothetical protein